MRRRGWGRGVKRRNVWGGEQEEGQKRNVKKERNLRGEGKKGN